MDAVSAGRAEEFKSSFQRQHFSAIADDTRPSNASVADANGSRLKGQGIELGCDHLIPERDLRIYEKGGQQSWFSGSTGDCCPEVMVLDHKRAAGGQGRP